MKTIKLFIILMLVSVTAFGQVGKSRQFIENKYKGLILRSYNNVVVVRDNTTNTWFYFDDSLCVEMWLREDHSSETGLLSYLSSLEYLTLIPGKEYVWYFTVVENNIDYVIFVDLFYDDGDKPYIRTELKNLTRIK